MPSTDLKSTVKNALHAILSRGQDYRKFRIRGGPAKGTYLNLGIRTQGSYWLGSYDDWIFDRVPLSLFIGKGDTAWDCGAYVGYYTAFFRVLVGDSGKIHTFEASASNAAQIRPLAQFNGWTNVALHEVAIGPEKSTITFSGEQGGSSGPVGLVEGTRAEVVAGVYSVRSAGVDEIVEDLGADLPDFIKFDLETGEIYALKNGNAVFSKKRSVILLELHGQEAQVAALEFAKTYDYLICDVYDLPADKGASAAADRAGWFKLYAGLAAKFMANPPASPPHMTLALPREKTVA